MVDPRQEQRADGRITRAVHADVEEHVWRILDWKRQQSGIMLYRLIENAIETTYGDEYRSAHDERSPSPGE